MSLNPPFSELEQLLRARLQTPLEAETAHMVFAPRRRGTNLNVRIAPPDARQAAALIVIYPLPIAGRTPPDAPAADHEPGIVDLGRSTEPAIALTVRRADLPDHPGQISLPGGRIDAGETAEAAALREAAEEANVDAASLRVLGALSPLYVPVSRFVIAPFVAIADTRPNFQPSVHEVAEILEVPLAHLLNASTLKWGKRTREGYLVDFPYFDVSSTSADPAFPNGHVVWGATAMILGEFTRLLNPRHGDALHT